MAGVLRGTQPASPPPPPNPSLPGVQGVLTAPQAPAPFGSNAPGVPPTQQPFTLRQPYFAGPPQPSFAAPPPASGQLPNQAPPGQPGQPQPPAPAPTHAQALAALRHFSAIEKVIAGLARDPALGKSSIKKQIVDAVAGLVANRIMSAPQAVQELSMVPERPFDQKQWLAQQFIAARQTRAQIAMDYARAHPGGAMDRTFSPDNHIDDMTGLDAHYRPHLEMLKQRQQ